MLGFGGSAGTHLSRSLASRIMCCLINTVILAKRSTLTEMTPPARPHPPCAGSNGTGWNGMRWNAMEWTGAGPDAVLWR